MTVWRQAEKNARARELGYLDYDNAIIIMYLLEELSLRQVGEWFGMSWQAVRFRLLNHHEVTFRPRGGDQYRRSS